MTFSEVKAAADSGNNLAQFDVAQRYYNDCGVDDDTVDREKEAAATRYMRLAADSGLVEAQYELACYHSESREEQTKYYIMAADNGHADAMESAASAYMWGDGIKQDLRKVAQYYTKYLSTSEDQELRHQAVQGLIKILGFDLEKLVADLGVILPNGSPKLPEKKPGGTEPQKNDKFGG
jgi:TPR repeat protein